MSYDTLPHDTLSHDALSHETLSGAVVDTDPAGIEALFAGANGRLLADLPVRMSVEVGQATMKLGAILQLGAGSIVELDRPADAPVDIKVNGTLIAHGEVVAEHGRFAVRLLDIVRPADAGAGVDRRL